MKPSAGPKIEKCPVCGVETAEILRLDGGFKLRLRESGQAEPIPDFACATCFSKFTEVISQGAQLRAKENAKQQHRMSMWRNRMNVIKQARARMEAKNFAEAAVLYEKYLRILEIIYEIEAGTLTPELFKNRARNKEVTLITSVYWDLARIYDSAGHYRERLEKTINKLLLFAPHSGILPQLGKNVMAYQRFAKNTDSFKRLEKEFGIKRSSCFIATAAFESEDAQEVIVLRRFRDQVLENYWLGRAFINLYYKVSPSLVPVVEGHPRLKLFIRRVLSALTKRI